MTGRLLSGKLETKENLWCKFQSESESRSRRSLAGQLKEGENPPFLSFFVPFSPAVGWMGLSHIREDNLLYSVY